ncbi:MAG: arylsulfatase [Niabella sp.]
MRSLLQTSFLACLLFINLNVLAVNPGDSVFVKNRPNIIFILADDLGYGDLGVYGQQKIKTPHLDKMSRQGMRFTQFYSGTSVCAPSRSTFMTGQHTGHTPIRGNKETKPEGQWPLPANANSVAKVLQNAGYITGDFGKWGLGYIETSGNPLNQGFDRFYGYNCQAQAHNYFPNHLWNNNEKLLLKNTLTHQTQYAADMIQQEALNFLDANSQKPFFLFLSYTLPHAALQLPKNDPDLLKYRKIFNEKPKKVNDSAWIARGGKGYQPQAYPHAAYAAMVTKLDRYVGEVMHKLKELNIDENTIVFFASDNGPHLEGGNDPKFFNSSGGLKGTKRDLYEGGIRTAFIARWPGKIRQGTTSGYVGAFWDLLPTFAQLADAPSPENIDGISFVPELLGTGTQKHHKFLYWEFHENGGRQAVRMGNWKGVKYNASEDPDSPIQLYNLITDRGEINNIADAHPEIVKQIATVLQNEHTENTDFPFFKNK